MTRHPDQSQAAWPISGGQSWPQTIETGAGGPLRIVALGIGGDTYQQVRGLLERTRAGAYRLRCVDALDRTSEVAHGAAPDAYLIEAPGRSGTGSDILAAIPRARRRAPVIVIARQPSPELETRAMQEGASDVLAAGDLDARLLTYSLHHAGERWRMEQALGESQRRFEDIAEVAADWLWEMDEELRMTFVSPRIGEITGFDPADAIGKTRWEFAGIDLERDPHWAQHKADLDARRPFRNYCYSSTDPNGDTFHFKLNGKPVFDQEGIFRGYRGTGTDITAEIASLGRAREAESQLLQARKLESIGELAAGIAHEINTPTQYVGDNTRFLRDAFRDLMQVKDAVSALLAAARDGAVAADLIAATERTLEDVDIEYLADEVPGAIEQSLEGVRRITKIVGAMKEFCHPGGDEKEMADLNRIIDSALIVASNEWKYVADLDTHLDPSLTLVPCYPPALGQAVLNLLVNAAHAIADVVGVGSSERGKLVVSTQRTEGMAEIRIADTGTGIAQALQDRIFDPFFTTKDVGKGTGQGLAIARATIVDQHGGILRFETEPGAGTTFFIALPLTDGSSEASSPV